MHYPQWVLGIWGKLKAPSAVEPIKDPQRVSSLYSHWRVRVLYSTFLGYIVYYFCRKNLSAATPAMIHDLGISKTSIGLIWSIHYFMYGVTKFTNGVLADRANGRYFIAIGLFMSALMNIFFGMSSSLIFLGLFWAMNGYFQSMGAPTCVRLICHWYSPNELGTKWSLWNISHQVGAGIILVLAGYLSQTYGWRFAFYVPAVLGILGGLLMIDRLRDSPESMGLPSVEDYRNDHAVQHDDAVAEGAGWKELLKAVVTNKQIWMLSMANFFVYLVRYGAMDWAPTFLVEAKGSSVAAASVKTAMFEVLGILGAIGAGWISDKYFVTKRYLINVFYMFVMCFVIVGFWWLPAGYPTLDAVLLSALGFLVYGPQFLVGVCTADISGKVSAATANGLNGFMGYMGSIISGVGTGWIVEHYGWNGGFTLFLGAAFMGGVLFLFTGSPHKRSA